MSTVQDALAVNQNNVQHRGQYDSRTPDNASQSDVDREKDKDVMAGEETARRRSGSINSLQSSSEDGDEELLPSFGGEESLEHEHDGYKGLLAGASTTSLGLNTQNHNGFISRDEVSVAGAGNGDVSMDALNLGSSKARRGNKGKGKGKVKKPSWKERERQRNKVFAREMAFVTVPSILLSMVGSVLAGEVLAHLKTWPVFLRVEELFILVPILLNLKGNLEMNLAARFSTSANIGELDLRQTRRSLVLGNMALLQVQALLVSLIAGLVAFVLGLMSRHGLADTPSALTGNDIAAYGVERGGYFECLMVLCASMIAASSSSAVVGAFMCSLVVVSRFLRINPDNLATPLAASLGDLLALVILGLVANEGIIIIGTLWSTFIFVALLFFIAINVYFTLRNAYVQELVWGGWVPLMLALCVSSGTGLVLQNYVNEFRGFGLLVPVVTGVAGNVGAIFVSRISTALHGAKEERYWLTAGTLFGISSPILIAFLGFVWATDQMRIGVAFAFCYILLSFGIMAVSLLAAYYLTFWLWSRDYDPDINALPLLSSAVDLFGQLMLVGAYVLAKTLGGDVLLPTPIVTPDGEVILNATSTAAISAAATATAKVVILFT